MLCIVQAQEQAQQTTSASLLEEFEKNNDNPITEQSQTTCDGTVSPQVNPAATVSSTYNSVQPPAVSHQLPSVENESINVTTANPASSQLYPNAGTSPQTATSSYSGLPQNNGLPESNIIPNAMNVLLDMNDTDISQELMAYESEGIDSGASPNSPLSFTPSYTTPPNLPMDRSFSLPPRNFQSQMWHGAGRYRNYSISDYVSVIYNVRVKSLAISLPPG